MPHHRVSWFVCVIVLASACGCASENSSPPPSGFLSDYSALQVSDDGTHRFSSPDLKNYNAFIIDPVQLRNQGKNTKVRPAEQAQIAQYFNQSLGDALRRRGYKITDTPGVGVARFRLALTDIQASKWWRNHDPEAVSALGTAGAAMEGEIIDSITGRQLGAVIQKGQSQQAALQEFTTMEDLKDTIDQWTRAAATRLDEIHLRAKQ